MLKWCVSAGHLLVSIHTTNNLSFLCASTRSFILYSSLCLVHISHTLFSIQTFIIAIHATSLLFNISNSSMIRSAYIFATIIVASILQGSSISQLISILQYRQNYQSYENTANVRFRCFMCQLLQQYNFGLWVYFIHFICRSSWS